VSDKTHITSVVLNSDHVILVDRWTAEIVGRTQLQVEEWRKEEDAVCSKSAAGTFKNLNQFVENSRSHKITTGGSIS
jgi:hypothetical protein